jgi:nucleotide-binding universal stress UspA family protein
LTGNRGPGRAVVAAVDLGIGLTPTSEEAQGQTELNRRILDTAARLAERLDRELHVIHVWEATGEHLVRRWSGGEAAVIRYVSETETQHEKALARLVDSTQQRWLTDPPCSGDAPAIHWHQLRGNPRTVIPEQASVLQAEVLVMGTIARTGVPGLIIGNTAEDILNRAPCSLVTVKPPGFVSPAT